MGSLMYPKRANRLRNLLHERISETIVNYMSNTDPTEVRDASDVLTDLLFDQEFVTEDSALDANDKAEAEEVVPTLHLHHRPIKDQPQA